eukprot:scaffold88345_cov58-Phaeocystis_antarctica.AAC.6
MTNIVFGDTTQRAPSRRTLLNHAGLRYNGGDTGRGPSPGPRPRPSGVLAGGKGRSTGARSKSSPKSASAPPASPPPPPSPPPPASLTASTMQ